MRPIVTVTLALGPTQTVAVSLAAGTRHWRPGQALPVRAAGRFGSSTKNDRPLSRKMNVLQPRIKIPLLSLPTGSRDQHDGVLSDRKPYRIWGSRSDPWEAQPRKMAPRSARMWKHVNHSTQASTSRAAVGNIKDWLHGDEETRLTYHDWILRDVNRQVQQAQRHNVETLLTSLELLKHEVASDLPLSPTSSLDHASPARDDAASSASDAAIAASRKSPAIGINVVLLNHSPSPPPALERAHIHTYASECNPES
jgi:hypothetical protein